MKTELRVRGMHCGHCVASISAELESMPEINGFNINLEEGRLVLETAETPDLEKIQKALAERGNYQLERLP